MPPPERRVAPDQFEITTEDEVLAATLSASFALCFYDAVHEAGALVHLRGDHPARPRSADLTDTTLSNDLLLIDRCTETLRASAPRLQHLQARLIAQVDDTESALHRFAAHRELLEGYLSFATVKLVSTEHVTERNQVVRFRPSMGKAWLQSA